MKSYVQQRRSHIFTSFLAGFLMLALLIAVVSPAPHASAAESSTQEHQHDHDHEDEPAPDSHDPNHHFHSYGGEVDHTPVIFNYIKPVKDEEAGIASSWDMPPNEHIPSRSQQTLERPPRSAK